MLWTLMAVSHLILNGHLIRPHSQSIQIIIIKCQSRPINILILIIFKLIHYRESFMILIHLLYLIIYYLTLLISFKYWYDFHLRLFPHVTTGPIVGALVFPPKSETGQWAGVGRKLRPTSWSVPNIKKMNISSKLPISVQQ